ncbi:unnamed protein product [Prunus armeniaca]
MMLPKFWTQSDIDWSVKLDNSGPYAIRSGMEWLVYSIVLSIGFHSKLTKLLLPLYCDVPQVSDSIRYRLVHGIVQFSFGLNPISIGPRNWTIEPLDFTQNSPNYSSLYIVMFPKFGLNTIPIGPRNWTIHVRMKFVLKWSVDVTQTTPNDSSHHIMMFPKFSTQFDIDWSQKLDNSCSYEARSEMEWLPNCIVLSVRTKFVLKWSGWCIAWFYPLDFTHNSPADSSFHIMMFPMFWTQSDIDWPQKLVNLGSYEVRSEMEWILYCIVLSIGFRSQLPKRLVPPCYDVPQFYPLDFTQNSPNCSSLYIIMFPKFRTQSDID